MDLPSPGEAHHVRPQHLLAGDACRVLRRAGCLGIDAGDRLRDGGEGLPCAAPLGVGIGELPAEGAVAELLVGGDDLRRDEAGNLSQDVAPGVVLLRGAGTLDPHPGEGDLQEARPEGHRLPPSHKGDPVPAGDVQPAPGSVLLHGGVVLQIAFPTIPDLRVYAQHGAEGDEAIGEQSPQPVLLHLIGHDVLFDVHGGPPWCGVGVFSWGEGHSHSLLSEVF